MNIFVHELHTYRKSTLVWILALVGLIAMYLFVYPAFTKDMASINKLVEGYPEVVKKAIGLTVGSFTTIIGYYTLTISFVLLCGAIQAMNLGLSVISKEATDKLAANYLANGSTDVVTGATSSSKLFKELVEKAKAMRQ